MGAADEKGLFWEGRWGGARRRKAAALLPRLRQGKLYGKSESQQWPRVSNNFCSQSEGGSERQEMDRDGNSERVVFTHFTHRALFSILTSGLTTHVPSACSPYVASSEGFWVLKTFTDLEAWLPKDFPYNLQAIILKFPVFTLGNP